MSETATPEAPAKTALPRYVRDALSTAGVKVADLTEEQRARAESAEKEKGGLRGKALATFILDGQDLKTQTKEAAKSNASAAKKKASEGKKQSTRYPAWVPEAVARGRHLSGQKAESGGDETMAYAGPIQHMKVRKLMTKELGGTVDEANGHLSGVTPEQILEAAGIKSIKALTEIATFKAEKSEMRPMRDLGKKFGNDGWAKGRFLAAVLVIWIEDIKKAAK